MLLRYFYDRTLAHASYMVGCQRAKEAVIVDPGRDIGQYLEASEREGVKIVAVAETHIHADYVSGARELADRIGAKLYVSDEGPAEWKYRYAAEYSHCLCKDGDKFSIGKIDFEVVHTPGHTPESISFVLTDRGGGATSPMGIFSGDFVFVGSIGRPDLLEEAAGMMGTAEVGARQLFHSVERFRDLPDHLQVWPAHGAGSACGKGLGAIPSSTVGYEKLFNPALQHHDEEEFVHYILADQPEAPRYFAVMKRVNKEGPKVLGPYVAPKYCEPGCLDKVLDEGAVVDLRAPADFSANHAPGTLNIPAGMLAGWAGWLLDYDEPLRLIAEPGQLSEAVRVLNKIGLDEVVGVFSANELAEAGLMQGAYRTATPQELAEQIAAGDVTLVDVRAQGEWEAGHIPQAEHYFLGKLKDSHGEITRDKPVVTQCQSGMRSSIAASVFTDAGYDVINMTGGYAAWQKAGFPTELGGACEGGSACVSH
ncbi:putative polyketide biosynthesis zinc-dependent hydrolase BaeB [Posidoniimonas polymericola]|uniref:Putative polyketide biosynthesis zinc-dependent hydrolase BaeB n=1 Tax=Posidoniimonas polymericola TaxID=2528002 RepID=A0A5C5YMR7_9BACT|nr:MBL fold metallo-hydrolase [Posidoniimonas polymericola]TWT76166.1 putative polyketide biosynthesis zinc-dependent hydrolase BaeB [Posidoniimonas polymericola]